MVVSTHPVEASAACTTVVLFAGRRLVFPGPPDELASVGRPGHEGNSPLERDYWAMVLNAESVDDHRPVDRCRRARRRPWPARAG